MRRCCNWRGKVCRRDHAIRVVIGPRLSGMERQHYMLYLLQHPEELWRKYAECVARRRQRKR